MPCGRRVFIGHGIDMVLPQRGNFTNYDFHMPTVSMQQTIFTYDNTVVYVT